jgi:ribosomal protein S20
MVAAQDDEGSTMRIEELERRKNLAESVAQRIFDKGMIKREESTRTKSRAFTDC